MRGVAREKGKSPACRALCAPEAAHSTARRVRHRAKGGAARFRAAPPISPSGRAGLIARRSTERYSGLISRQVPGTCLQVSENCRPRFLMQLS